MLGQLTGSLQENRSGAQAVELRVQTLEEQHTSSTSLMDAMKIQLGSYQQRLVTMQLHMEDAENRSRRNNVRLKGIPEATISGHPLQQSLTYQWATLHRL